MLEAQEMLRALTISDWPKMKQHRREELHRKIHRTAYPKTYSKPVSVASLANILGLGTIK